MAWKSPDQRHSKKFGSLLKNLPCFGKCAKSAMQFLSIKKSEANVSKISLVIQTKKVLHKPSIQGIWVMLHNKQKVYSL